MSCQYSEHGICCLRSQGHPLVADVKGILKNIKFVHCSETLTPACRVLNKQWIALAESASYPPTLPYRSACRTFVCLQCNNGLQGKLHQDISEMWPGFAKKKRWLARKIAEIWSDFVLAYPVCTSDNPSMEFPFAKLLRKKPLKGISTLVDCRSLGGKTETVLQNITISHSQPNFWLSRKESF